MTPSPTLAAHLCRAAEQFGTPLYAYDGAVIAAAVARVRQAFGAAHIYYAMKANPNVHLLRLLTAADCGLGCGLDCVSAGEVARAEHLGLAGRRVLVNGCAKSEAEYAAAARLGAVLVLDRAEEVGLLPPKSQVLLRVNPALKVSTHDHLATGAADSKFGVPSQQAAPVAAQLRAAGHHLLGLHLHIGSAIEDAGDFALAFEKVAALYGELGPLDVVDVGGGWAIDADLAPIAQRAWALARHFGAELWVEPGRYLVARAGYLLTRVVGQKVPPGGQPLALLDTGMTELIRPMLYGATHPVYPLWQRAGATQPYDLAGPVCESGDILARQVPLEGARRGDLLAFGDAGAYGAAMSSNYLSRPRPAEVLLSGGEWRVIRQREALSSLWALEE